MVRIILSYTYSASNPKEEKQLNDTIVSQVDINGNTPLHYCFFRNNPVAGEMLLKKEIASLFARNKLGQ